MTQNKRPELRQLALDNEKGEECATSNRGKEARQVVYNRSLTAKVKTVLVDEGESEGYGCQYKPKK